MTELIIGTILAIVICIAGIAYGHDSVFWHETMALIVGTVAMLVAIVGISFLCIFGYNWQSAKVKAEIINREYHTRYTQEEIFYASDVIDTIRQIDRTRLELQGLNKEEK